MARRAAKPVDPFIYKHENGRQKRQIFCLILVPKGRRGVRADATQLLARASRGDQAAVRDLAPLVYDELRALARRHLAPNSAAGTATLQPTALVHEAFLRLIEQNTVDYRSRTHFLAAAAVAMRCVLLDHVRARGAAKRGGGWHRITLTGALTIPQERDIDLLALDEALSRLAEKDPRAARIVELRFFGGLSHKEVASEIGVSERTVRNDWSIARAWLRCELAGTERTAPP
jgi:RNA polymerase sigma-70 factor (ECF subfamily)